MPREPRANLLSRLTTLLGLTGEESASTLLGASLDALQRHSRRQLLEWSGRLGLADIQSLTTAALARRVQAALAALGVDRTPPDASPDEPADVARKFALGPEGGAAPPPAHISWGYGQNRVTAMMVDPDRLYVYWEITDEGIARARAGLGPGGSGAWVNLRVYDVTGRLFDGTNAHGYIDQRVERTDRQWFFDIGRPGSTTCVELGLRSREGYFVRTARSGRVDFPRREPVAPGEVEWLTVDTATGPAGSSGPGGPVPAPGESASGAAPAHETVRNGGRHGALPDLPLAGERPETLASEWVEDGRLLEWRGPVVGTTWEAGPFSHPVESPAYVEERHAGTVTVTRRRGRVYVVYGPWRVVIHGLGAWGERRVVATWELRCAWVASNGVGRAPGVLPLPAGSSDALARDASERAYGGASEWSAGPNELAYGRASEGRPGGASETAARVVPRR